MAQLKAPLAEYAAYLGVTVDTTTIVKSNGKTGTHAFLPTIQSSRLRHPFPYAIYLKTFDDANLLCNLWIDFLEKAVPFPLLEVGGGTTVAAIGGSSQTSPVIEKFCDLGFDAKFDCALQHCKPIFALPYSQYPGLYIHEYVSRLPAPPMLTTSPRDAARLSVQGCAARFRPYNIVTNSFATAFEAILCNAWESNRPRSWRKELVSYDFALSDDTFGGPLAPLPPHQHPLPPPGPLVDPHTWEEPCISSSPFPSPAATPSRQPSHQAAIIRTPSHTPSCTPVSSPKGIACRLFDTGSAPKTSPRIFPEASPSRNRLLTPSRATSPLVEVTYAFPAPRSPAPAYLAQPASTLSVHDEAKSPLRQAASEGSALARVLTKSESEPLPDDLCRLISAFFSDHVTEAMDIFAAARRYKNFSLACTNVIPHLPRWMTLQQFTYCLEFIFDSGDPIPAKSSHRKARESSRTLAGTEDKSRG
ncbi:hypothetical protein CYLTODRAFT_476148 [Cylindrobasidium torrendii FP15055 ss-10]|uniref:Uncharacterized protein n=1 Tax=Cylindrobasidium torrendii FP15055 ss-10 TaxID=1314674 RepID=A0A0D7AVM3_9AGAR|nr:hypothetical protein CYLTODRAFT_476148 [Cylindrobasidium torrendii FP15055 ss-10]